MKALARSLKAIRAKTLPEEPSDGAKACQARIALNKEDTVLDFTFGRRAVREAFDLGKLSGTQRREAADYLIM